MRSMLLLGGGISHYKEAYYSALKKINYILSNDIVIVWLDVAFIRNVENDRRSAKMAMRVKTIIAH